MFLNELQLITAKPVMYICNGRKCSQKWNNYVEIVKNDISSEDAELILGAAIEADIAELEDYEERKLF